MGELPKSFKFWLESCKNNVEIDWILITDQKIENLKSIKNIRIINSSLESLKSRFEKKLQMSISLQKAYKLCDYKPSYGLFFEEELKEYNYWGYCDMDMVFGKILKILPKDLPFGNQYDCGAVLFAGSGSVYRSCCCRSYRMEDWKCDC